MGRLPLSTLQLYVCEGCEETVALAVALDDDLEHVASDRTTASASLMMAELQSDETTTKI